MTSAQTRTQTDEHRIRWQARAITLAEEHHLIYCARYQRTRRSAPAFRQGGENRGARQGSA